MQARVIGGAGWYIKFANSSVVFVMKAEMDGTTTPTGRKQKIHSLLDYN